MPIPKPKKDEKEQDFISRCMGDDAMNKEYPKQEQRAAICYQSWRDEDKKTEGQPVNPETLQNLEFLAGQPISSIDAEKRTVDVLFFSGIDIPRLNFWSGETYVLRFDPKGADLSLLNNGAPVLDNHNRWDGTASQKGKVEKAWGPDQGKFYATLRFSKRLSVNELWNDIEDRIVTKFSMGVEILKSEKLQEKEQQILLATKWRPFELSVAPIPADWNTATLAAVHRGRADTTITVTNNQLGTSPKENSMPDKVDTMGTGAQPDDSAIKTAEQIYDDQLKNSRDKGVIAELARTTAILEVNRICGLPPEFATEHIKARTDINKFRELAINKQAELATAFGPARTGQVRMVRDEQVTRRELMSAAVSGLLNPKDRKEDSDNPFMGLSIKEIASESVRLGRGMVRMPPMTKVIELAMQTTSDFAYVLENVARKQLLNRYEAIAPTYRIWCKRSTSPDFKTMSRVRLSETPAFLKVPEGAQITIGMMSDTREQYSLATYGRGVSFTRQMLVNDDLGAFNDLIGAFGVQAARLENKTVYAILYANANMADNNPLFDDTTHHNTGTGVLGNTAYDAMFGKMGAQLGLDGETVLNIIPKYIIVPKAKESTARASVLATGPNLAASSQNWFSGRLEPVADGELDTNGSGTTKWYAAADPNLFPGIEYCHLEGAEGPQFVRKDNESGILGIQFYAYVDFAAKAVDWRPLYYSTGS